MAAGQQIIVIVDEDTGLIANEQMVKINALVTINSWDNMNPAYQVHQSSYSSTPNSQGVAVFDFGRVIENYVKPQHNGVLSNFPTGASYFQGTAYDSLAGYHPVHNIDRYCYAPEVVNYINFIFTMEYLGAGGNPNVVEESFHYLGSDIFFVYNGVLYKTDELSYRDAGSPDFGYDLQNESFILNGIKAKFLTDAPTTQFARVEDYGTVAFFNNLSDNKYSFTTSGAPDYGIKHIKFTLYDSSDVVISTFNSVNLQSNGGWSGIAPDAANTSATTNAAQIRYLFAGVYPANLRGWSIQFRNALSAGTLDYYTFEAQDYTDSTISATYRVNTVSECRYEPIRLAWLNKHGAWDYYTFMKKNVRSLTSKRTQYQKLDGTWNEKVFNLNKNIGGRKTFKTVTTEKIRLNTDYINVDIKRLF